MIHQGIRGNEPLVFLGLRYRFFNRSLGSIFRLTGVNDASKRMIQKRTNTMSGIMTTQAINSPMDSEMVLMVDSLLK